MNIFRHISFIVILLMGFANSSFSAARAEGNFENDLAPEMQQQQVRSLARSLGYSHCQELESFLGTVPAAELENLVHDTKKILVPCMDAGRCDAGRCLDIIKALYAVPGVDERTRLVDFLKSSTWMQSFQLFDSRAIALVIRHFSQIPFTERAEVASVADRIDQEVSKLVRRGKRTYLPEGSKSYWNRLLVFPSAVEYIRKGANNASDREDLFRLAQQLFSANIPALCPEDLLNVLTLIPDLGEKHSFVRLVSTFIDNPLLEILKTIEQPQSKKIGNLRILRNLAKLRNDAERTKILKCANRIHHRDQHSHEFAEIMEVFAGFPAEEDQESFLTFLSDTGLFANYMRTKTCASIIKSLHSIDMEERQSSLDCILSSGLIPQTLRAGESIRNDIIEALLCLSNDEIRSFEEFFRQNGFITEGIDYSVYVRLIRLGHLSSAERQSFLDFLISNSFMTPSMSRSNRAEVISLCIDCQPTVEGCRRLLTMARPFMTPNMTVDDKVSLIQFFSIRLNDQVNSHVTWEDAELLASYALQLITPGMTSHDRLSILQELAAGHTMCVERDLYFNREMLEYRMSYTSQKLHEATLQSLITQDNIFTYTHEFLKEAQEVGPLYRSYRPEDGNDFSPKLMRTGAPINIVRGEPIRRIQRDHHRVVQHPGIVFVGPEATLVRRTDIGFGQDAPLVGRRDMANIDVVGQEAISAQRRAIKETYETLATSEETSIVISRNLPSLGAENEVFVAQTTRLNQVLEFLLKTQRLPDAQKMKLINALLSIGILTDHLDSTTIERVRAISPEIHAIVDQLIGQDNNRQIPRHGISNAASYRRHSHPDLPNIRQFFALVYNLLDQQMGAPSDPNEFTRSWLAETFANNPKAWGKFKVAFYHDFHIALPGTVGEALANPSVLETHFASCLENLLKEGELSESTHKDLHIAVGNLAKSYGVAFKERYTPLIEALAMIMRGHNNDLDSLRERNNPACAEGAYLGIIKVLQEIPNMSHIVGTSLAHIDVVACGDAVRRAAPDISAINLGAAQDTAEQARALRAAQDVEYAASLAADRGRAIIAAQGAAAASEEVRRPEPSQNDSNSQSVPTLAQRRAIFAAAAEARTNRSNV